MKRQALMVFFLLAVSTSEVIGDDKIVGAAWEIKLKDTTVRFRATSDGKVYDAGSAVVGSWKGDKEKAEMEITGFKNKRDGFNGKYVLTNISKDVKSPRWTGKWTPQGGDKSKDVVVKLLKD